MKPKPKPPVNLQRHCWNLSVVLQDIWQHSPVTVTNKDGVTFEWPDAAEWLDLAAGIQQVEVVTGAFDLSLMYCESALDYENARSDCLSMLATHITMFTFVWGAFEIIGNLIQPASIPPALRQNGENSLVDRLICLLRSEPPLMSYSKSFACLQNIVSHEPHYSRFLRKPPLPTFFGPAGEGIDFVRRIRNQFAHGAAKFPQPHEWGEDAKIRPSAAQSIVAHCTLIALFTIQMLLKRHFSGQDFEVRGPDSEEQSLHAVLDSLHLGEADTGH